jgi:hypothetical protein
MVSTRVVEGSTAIGPMAEFELDHYQEISNHAP